jgi:serine/threonine protein kinase/CheY-like chemotaxis protein
MLPRRQVSAPAVVPGDRAPVGAVCWDAMGQQVQSAPGESRGRLLLVDDSITSREVLGIRLRDAGFEVLVASSGREALEVVDREIVDVVLTDVTMPEMSGLELLERLRRKFSKLELPVLMVTARSDSADIVRALELGANDYVTKPIDVAIAIARIHGQVALRAQYTSVRGAAARLGGGGAVEPGTIVDGRYKVLSIIGQGGFAVVYRALQISSGQTVALKVLRSYRVHDSEAVDVELARFEREMRLIGRLNHAHVVRLFDSGYVDVCETVEVAPSKSATATVRVRPALEHAALDGEVDGDSGDEGDTDGCVSILELELQTRDRRHQKVPYLVMEYLDGLPLSSWMARERPLTVERAVELFLPILSAVAAAHAQGIVHRDLKPQNIFVVDDESGRPFPKVLDFGVAKLVDEENATLTGTSALIGTPKYLSPEQARGEREIDGRSDEFAIGTILYEALTGAHPFQAGSIIEYVHRIARCELDPPRTLRPDLPQAVEEVLMRSLALRPEDRYPDLVTFGADLLRFGTMSVRARWARSFGLPSDPAPRR